MKQYLIFYNYHPITGTTKYEKPIFCFPSVRQTAEYSPLKQIQNICALIFFICILTFLSGCGKKGPPVPPHQKPIPIVTDLKYKIENSIITLFWTNPAEKGKAEPAGFYIYRSKEKTFNQNCDGCPEIFKQIADITSRNMEHTLKYKEQLNPGYRYIYKITAYTKNKIKGESSNHVNFLF